MQGIPDYLSPIGKFVAGKYQGYFFPGNITPYNSTMRI
jgi:hypothetical protein